ncbi:MAG TPA: spore cortex-lytic enzyme [Firmicutes bacterium]|nr:spore cortex-lytic enzyme [Bacillota bacterium]
MIANGTGNVRRRTIRRIVALVTVVIFMLLLASNVMARPTLYWGTTGKDVRVLQWRLQSWGYYDGRIDGVFGNKTSQAVKHFQWKNGLPADGIVGQRTWQAMGLWSSASAAQQGSGGGGISRGDDINLLARIVTGEARAEPYLGKVAVAAVLLNRVRSPKFPNTLSGVVYQPHAFESVTNGEIWRTPPTEDAYKAAQQALNGWDPTYGSLFFWNPAKAVSKWIWSRPIVTRIGGHVFAK